MISSTFSGNSASGSPQVGHTGGGISNSGVLVVTNSTFAGNSSTHEGGGIYNESAGTVSVTNSTFADNEAGVGGGRHNVNGRLTLTNSILARNPAGGDCVSDGPPAPDGRHNLIADSLHACGLTNGANSNVIGPLPLLAPAGLQNYGGPTQTIALLAGSPAIDGGDANYDSQVTIDDILTAVNAALNGCAA